jgi:hypothetical protein
MELVTKSITGRTELQLRKIWVVYKDIWTQETWNELEQLKSRKFGLAVHVVWRGRTKVRTEFWRGNLFEAATWRYEEAGLIQKFILRKFFVNLLEVVRIVYRIYFRNSDVERLDSVTRELIVAGNDTDMWPLVELPVL